MSWDRTKAVDYFMNQYHRYNPEQYKFRPNVSEWAGQYDTELALQKVYMDCAAAANEKERLLARLNYLIKCGAEDNRAHNAAEFKSMVKLEAADIRHQIETGRLSF